ncbi:hypothetical protein EA672_16795, partial [Acinetobacter baumannii]
SKLHSFTQRYIKYITKITEQKNSFMVESQPLEMPYKKTATWIRLQSRIMDIRTHIHYELF